MTWTRRAGRRECSRLLPASRFAAAVLLLLVVLFHPVITSQAAAAPTIFFEPDTLRVPSDQTEFENAIWIDDAGDSIACFRIVMAFDSSKVELLNAVEGSLFADSGLPTFFVWDSLAADTSSFLDCVLGYGTFVLGPGELVRLTWRRATDESLITELVLSEVIVTDVHRQQIPGVGVHNGYLYLNAPSSVDDEGSSGSAAPYLRITPNPTCGHVWIAWGCSGDRSGAAWGGGESLPVLPGRMQARVLDPAGRVINRVALHRDGPLYVGSWSGLDWGNKPVAAGAYFIALDPPGLVCPGRVIHLGSSVRGSTQ